MTFTLKSLSRNGKNAFYTGGAVVLRFNIAAFPNKQPPSRFEVQDGVFAGPRTPKAKLSPEERKALRQSKPKPTFAEKLEMQRKRLAAMEAKAQKEGVLASM